MSETTATQIALFDTSAGFMQWIGHAENYEDAIRQHLEDVGFNEDVEYELLVLDVTDAQAAALSKWADAGFKSPDYPDDLPAGAEYSAEEIAAIWWQSAKGRAEMIARASIYVLVNDGQFEWVGERSKVYEWLEQHDLERGFDDSHNTGNSVSMSEDDYNSLCDEVTCYDDDAGRSGLGAALLERGAESLYVYSDEAVS